jgi:hypothetical protein
MVFLDLPFLLYWLGWLAAERQQAEFKIHRLTFNHPFNHQ